MSHPSRFTRPTARRSGLVLQDRDRAIVRSVFNHRFVRSDHIHRLLFANTSLRVAQFRLRKLWEHGYLERYFVPRVFDGQHAAPASAGQPIYGLGKAGIALLTEELGATSDLPRRSHKKGALGLAALDHHLVVTNFMVALEVACRDRADARLTAMENETALWRKVAHWREHEGTGRFIVPDSVFTLAFASGSHWTFYLEVVRAGVRGGNRRLLNKLALYVTLHRQGFFRHAYGHDRLRAVLILTNSEARSERFRALAEELVHGRRLFWFGSYEKTTADGRKTSTLSTETILSRVWKTADNDSLSFTRAGVSFPNHHPHAHPVNPAPVAATERAAAHPRRDHVQEAT